MKRVYLGGSCHAIHSLFTKMAIWKDFLEATGINLGFCFSKRSTGLSPLPIAVNLWPWKASR